MDINIEVNASTYLKNPNSSELGRKIVMHSIQLIDELGFEHFTFKKLGDKIDSPESSIYRYFENKHTLLAYLTCWYWGWVEYKLNQVLENIHNPLQKLTNAVKIFTSKVEVSNDFAHINEVSLNRIIIKEGCKTYLIAEVDLYNAKGYFSVYKKVVKKVADIVLECNPHYKYPKMLISAIIEGSLKQRFFADHFPGLTDATINENFIPEFYTNMALKVIEE